MKIIFIIGGARSGKSSFALKEASKTDGQKAYIATAEALDDEMKERIEKHKRDRGEEWDTYEEPLKIAEVILNIKDKYSVIVLDCLTLWLSNIQNSELRTQNSDDKKQTAKKSIQQFIDTLEQVRHSSVCSLGSGFCVLYVVSNEVGMGIVPEDKQAREFRDLAGALNQKVAEVADEVYLMTAGIPIKIKD